MPKLSLGSVSSIDYRGIHMLTRVVIEERQFEIPLLNNGWTAITFFVRELERTCRLSQGKLHNYIAPLLKRFLTEMLFEETLSLNDPRLLQRLKDNDVLECILAVFVPLVLERITETSARRHFESAPMLLSKWKLYEFTASELNPVIAADKTIFNLVPCHRNFEVEFARWLDYAKDVFAFAKNAGPQALRIDYLDSEGRISHYIPDFFVRDNKGDYFLVETKGYPDPNVEYKKKAAHSWCQSASKASGVSWTYLFVHQTEWNFSNFRSLAELIPIATRMSS